MERQAISTKDTARLIKHALASGKITNKKLAELLDVPESRISEGKSEGWRMRVQQATLLIEKFGQPRSKPGRYVMAELADSIKAFIDREPELSSLRHWEKIIGYMGSELTQQNLFAFLKGTRFALDQAPDTRTKEEVFESFIDMLGSNFFDCWMNAALAWLKRASVNGLTYNRFLRKSTDLLYFNVEVFDSLPLDVQTPNEMPHDASLIIHAESRGLKLTGLNGVDILLLASFFREINKSHVITQLGLQNGFSLGDKSPVFTATVNSDFVITGDVVWEERGQFEHLKIGNVASESLAFPIPGERLIFCPEINEPPSLSMIESISMDWQVDCWTTYLVQLYINDSSEYTLLIELGDKTPQSHFKEALHLPKREVVISGISALHLFDELIVLRQWLDLEQLPEHIIKTNIAKAGGYIPGAIVL